MTRGKVALEINQPVEIRRPYKGRWLRQGVLYILAPIAVFSMSIWRRRQTADSAVVTDWLTRRWRAVPWSISLRRQSTYFCTIPLNDWSAGNFLAPSVTLACFIPFVRLDGCFADCVIASFTWLSSHLIISSITDTDKAVTRHPSATTTQLHTLPWHLQHPNKNFLLPG